MDSPHKKWAKPFEKKVAAAEPQAAAPSKPEASAPPDPSPSKELPWETSEDFINAFAKGDPNEETLKGYAQILGIDYSSDFNAFFKAAGDKFDSIRNH